MGKLFGAGGEGGPGSYAREMSGKTVRGKISGWISKGEHLEDCLRKMSKRTNVGIEMSGELSGGGRKRRLDPHAGLQVSTCSDYDLWHPG